VASNAAALDLSAPNSGHSSPFVQNPEPVLVTSLRDWSEFDTSERIARWDSLAQWACEPNPFYESWYLLPSLRALDPGGDVKILCFCADGQLAGIMPVRRSSRYYTYPLPNIANWVHPNCFLGTPLVALGCERAFWRAALAWADGHAGNSLFFHLSQMPLAGPLHEALEDVIGEQKRPGGIVMREERAMLASPLDSEDYFDTVCSKKRRKELRRQLNKLNELGETDFVWHWDDTDIASWTEDFLRIESSGWKGKSGSALACDPGTHALFTDAMHGAARDGKLVRLSLQHNGQPIAMLANFVDRPGSFGFKTAFNEAFSSFSPGVLLECEYLKTLDRKDITWCDSCAAPDHSVMSELWIARRSIGRISLGIGGLLRRGVFKAILGQEMDRQQKSHRQ